MRMQAYPRHPFAAGNFFVINDGNSLTAGQEASGPSAYWPAVANGLYPCAGLGVTPRNVAVAGQGIITHGAGPSTMAGRAAAQVDAFLQADKVNILTAMEYTNAVKYLSGDGTTAHAEMRTYCLARKSAAVSAGRTLRIVAVTAPPGYYGSAGSQATVVAWNQGLAQANELTRQRFREYADVLADLASLQPFAGIFATGTFLASEFVATGIYAADNGHFNDSGYALIGRFMARQYARVRK